MLDCNLGLIVYYSVVRAFVLCQSRRPCLCICTSQVSSHGAKMREFFEQHCMELENMADTVARHFQERVRIITNCRP